MNERGYHYVEYLGEGCIGCAACYYVCPEPSAIEVHVPERKREPEA
jgi:2-oxoisovalerate ferredoxin oxidoreductase delta subunit